MAQQRFSHSSSSREQPNTPPLVSSHDIDNATGRPNVVAIIGKVIGAAAKEMRVVVGACGPKGMVRDVRTGVSRGVKIGGAGVDLHVEEFAW